MDILALLVGVIVLPAAVILFTAAGERIITRLPDVRQRQIRPWFWLVPVALLIAAILIYPLLATALLAFQGSTGSGWVGLQNFGWVFSPDNIGILGNNLIWVIVLPISIAAIGTVMAVLIDRVRYEIVSRTLLVLPTAVSLTAAGISWQLLYAWSPQGQTQLGLPNAILQAVGLSPVPWTSRPPADGQWLNTLSLIAVATWAGLGIAVLVLSAAVKAVPAETLEAARMDGASEWRAFWSITFRTIWPSVLTVVTTQVMGALKIFDVVYVMTNGNSGTQVVANSLVGQLFNSPAQIGRASALALLLMLCAIPVVWFNVRSVKAEASA